MRQYVRLRPAPVCRRTRSARSLHKLRAAKVLAVEALRHDDTGQFVSVRYVIALDTLPIVLRTATEPESVKPTASRKSIAPQQLSMLA